MMQQHTRRDCVPGAFFINFCDVFFQVAQKRVSVESGLSVFLSGSTNCGLSVVLSVSVRSGLKSGLSVVHAELWNE